MAPSRVKGTTAQVASAAVTPRQKADPQLAAVLTRLRDERGLTQEGLAHRAGLTTSGYVRIEACASAPGWSTVRRVAEALDVTLAELGRLVEDQL